MLGRFQKYQLILLSLLSGLLLSLAWPAHGWAGFAFVALVPLFVVDYYVSKHSDKFSRGSMVLYSFITFLVFNLLTTWWVINSTIVGALLAFILNSLFMALVYGLFHLVKNRLFSKKLGYLSFILFWISYEYLHMHWSLSWSWLVFGNVFAAQYQWVQWYEYTGAFGGSVWVILVNVLFFSALITYIEQPYFKLKIIGQLALAFALIFIPISYSYSIYNNYQEQGKKIEAVIVQPNIDPYEEHYSMPPELIVENFLHFVRTKIDS